MTEIRKKEKENKIESKKKEKKNTIEMREKEKKNMIEMRKKENDLEFVEAFIKTSKMSKSL